jgi:hypothetical protein
MAHYNERMRSPQTDGSGTESINDTIGARDDDVDTTTLAGRIHSLEEHIHSPTKAYPTLADAPTVVAEAADWGMGGALVEIVPASTITTKFDIHYVNIERVSATRVYELFLYYGAGDTLAGHVRITKSAGLDPVLDRSFQTDIIPANSRIRARLASAGGVADEIDLTIQYHPYT